MPTPFALPPLLASLLPAAPAPAAPAAGADSALPAWVSQVGARRRPAARRVCAPAAYGAAGDGTTKATAAIQRAIDACAAAGGGVVRFAPGRYVTGALFLRSGIEFRVDSGVTLLGSEDEADYPVRPTRVAGIEMPWPAALINVEGARAVAVTGRGTIDGRGERWWDKYWTLRRAYEPRGLRWAADYDAARARLLRVARSSDVTVEQVTLRRSGFWTVHLLYSDHVTVDGVTVRDNGGPSTDGVDIDSSRWVLVRGTDIDNNDDVIVLKAGRDADGLRVGRPTEYVVVRDNLARRGAGVLSIGSETSGGIRHVVALDNRGVGTTAGLVLKSATTRGGVVEDVLVRGLTLERVPTAFSFTLDWNPSYSYAALPADTAGIPAYWRTLAAPVVPRERGLAEFRDVRVERVRVAGARRIFAARGLPERPIRGVRWRDVEAAGDDAGSIAWARDWSMRGVRLRTPTGAAVRLEHTVAVDAPPVARDPSAAAPPPPADSADLARWPAGAEPARVGRRVAENFLARRFDFETMPERRRFVVYPEVITWYGALQVAELARDTALRRRLVRKFDTLRTPAGAQRISPEAHVDFHVFGAVPLEIARQTGDTALRALGRGFADRQWADTTPDGLPREARYWVDDMYMLPLVQVQAYRATGDRVYLDRAAHAMVAYLDSLQQPDGFFHHGPGTPFNWGRGNGWFAAGMAEVLRELPAGHPRRARILAGYLRMMAALRRTQAPEGLWRQLVDRPESWLETSGSGMFAYALVSGVKAGWLDRATYGPAARRAWLALVARLDADANVRDVSVGTNKASQEVGPDRDTQYRFYLERERRTGDLHGQAPLLWTAAALLR
jgi:rhamnogalacturonyl hydrolase YesR